MKTSHTPGPWQVGQSIDAILPTKNGEMRACFTVTEVPNYVAGGGVAMTHIKMDADESNANARLIAAAPDLLAALEAAAEFCRRRGGSWAEFEGTVTAAIAKAKGQS